jgi:hypothetical protein
MSFEARPPRQAAPVGQKAIFYEINPSRRFNVEQSVADAAGIRHRPHLNLRADRIRRESLMAFVEELIDVEPARLARLWTDMWNRLCEAGEVVSESCRVYFGRKPQIDRPAATTGPLELQDVIDGVAWEHPGIRYSVESALHHQRDGKGGGLITLLWNVDVPGAHRRSGIDLLRWRSGRIVEVWSITADLELPAMR